MAAGLTGYEGGIAALGQRRPRPEAVRNFGRRAPQAGVFGDRGNQAAGVGNTASSPPPGSINWTAASEVPPLHGEHPTYNLPQHVAARKRMDDQMYFSDQHYQQKLEAIQKPHHDNIRTYETMGVPNPYHRGLQDVASRIQAGGPAPRRLGEDLVSPSQANLLAGRGGDYGENPMYPPASHFSFEGGLPNGAANDRRYRSATTFPSSTGNGTEIRSERTPGGGVALYGTPQEINGIPLTNGVGLNTDTGQAVYAQGLKPYFERVANRERESKAHKVLAMAIQNGVSMNSPLLRAVQERLGASPEQRRLQEVMTQARLQNVQRLNAQNASIQDEIHKTKLDYANGKIKPWDFNDRIKRLNSMLSPSTDDVYRQGLTPFAKKRQPAIVPPAVNSPVNRPLSDGTFPPKTGI